MKSAIPNLIVVAALSFTTSALAATEDQAPASPATAEASGVPATAAAPQQPRPTEKHLAAGKRPKAKGPRPKNLDLRHCLELQDNLAIARCAGE